MELGSSVGQYLVWFTVSFHGFFQEFDGVFSCGVVMDS
jgi:hypothetical protein